MCLCISPATIDAETRSLPVLCSQKDMYLVEMRKPSNGILFDILHVHGSHLVKLQGLDACVELSVWGNRPAGTYPQAVFKPARIPNRHLQLADI